jgi:uncharacterized phage protein gp47/JayE
MDDTMNQKTKERLPLVMLILGAAAAAVRWLLYSQAVDDTGLLIRDHWLWWLLWAVCAGAAAAVLPRNRGIGTVDVVIATHAGLPEEELIGQVQAWFEERREIAVDVQVLAPEEKNMDVSVRVKAKANYDGEAVRREVSDKLTNWFNGERLGQDVLLAHLNQVIYTIDGVENYVIDAPIADISVAKAELPRLGSLTVEELA